MRYMYIGREGEDGREVKSSVERESETWTTTQKVKPHLVPELHTPFFQSPEFGGGGGSGTPESMVATEPLTLGPLPS